MSMMMYFKKLFAKNKSSQLLNIAIRQDAVDFASLTPAGQFSGDSLAISIDNHLSGLMQIEKNQSEASNGQVILSASHYQINQVDKPKVPAEELTEALKWQLKDLVSINPDDMVLDYFDNPVFLAGVEKINVVCSSKSKLKAMVNELHKGNIELTSIIVEEFAFASLLPIQQEAQLLICQQPNEEIVILIVKAGQLYFHRRLRGTAKIAQRSEDELMYGIIDNLSLEIQRSSDFFERQLKQAPIKSIQVLLPIKQEAFVARKLSENTNVLVELLTLPPQFENARQYGVLIGGMMAQQNTNPANNNVNSVAVGQ